MAYRELPTGVPGLSCLWMHTAEAGAPPTRVLPDACCDLIWEAGAGVVVAGPDTTALLARLPAGAVLVGVRFAPGGGGPALAVGLDGWRDARVPVDGLVAPDATPAEALRRLAAHAAARVTAGPPDAAVAEAARRLAGDPRLRVAALAADLGLSERQLRRRSLAAAGHAPKVLQRVLRLQRVVRAMDAGDADLARLAADHGYADQAHLTGECRELAGLAPAALHRERAAAVGSR